ncbi:hypothetical protein BGT96_05860 [Clostridioides difficile]|nr:hypothetical protein [Clostridioides difficile]OFU09394.1 hypothetical protein HMPREF3083_02475 [Clostridium sp. HMSC19D07]OFU34633.1 hypothetical protein HMPREF3075_03775 [Clostridium sp. HMSC19B11]EGT4531070.1 hypothetical protein [Clostridioides difficile]EGT4699094.1 hypothetical protein [Clostridioides difficile]
MREIIRATGSAKKAFKSKDKQYKYKNETLIELLEIKKTKKATFLHIKIKLFQYIKYKFIWS